MGLQNLFRRSGTVEVVTNVDPYEEICREMKDSGRLFALYTKNGRYLVDQFGEHAVEDHLNPEEAFYLAMNLNYVHSFSNSVKMGIYDPSGMEMVSPELASFKLVYHIGEDLLVKNGGSGDEVRITTDDYSCGILLIRLKNPKDWQLPTAGMLRLNLQASMIFNPTELEDFLLKMPI